MPQKPRKRYPKLAAATRAVARRTHGVAKNIADRTGLTRGHISRVLSGERTASPEVIEAIGPALLEAGVMLQTAALQHEYPHILGSEIERG